MGAERTQKQREASVLEQEQPVVLCIQAYGDLCSNKAQGSDRVQGRNSVSSRNLCELLQTVRSKESRVKAVVLRIVSPGGVSTAAHSVFHEVMKVRESGRPVLACAIMPPVADTSCQLLLIGCMHSLPPSQGP
ncbi:TPA: hypothetical protein ACH3X3_012527 [Trebouxia sp. C0006]